MSTAGRGALFPSGFPSALISSPSVGWATVRVWNGAKRLVRFPAHLANPTQDAIQVNELGKRAANKASQPTTSTLISANR